LSKAFRIFGWLSTALVACAVLLLVIFLLMRGGRALSAGLIFGDTPWLEAVTGAKPVFGGLWPAIVGTLALVGLSAAMALPLGILSGIWLSEYGRGRLGRLVSTCVDLLAGIPSIVMGLFGFGLMLALRRSFFPDANTGLILAASCIALLVLPYLIRTTEVSLEGLPETLRLLGPSLGLSRWKSAWHVLLPAASRGILSGAILAVGRAAEDTAVILLTGAVASGGVPRRLSDNFEALPYKIYYLSANHRNASELDLAFGAALILLLLTGSLFVIAAWLQRGLEKRWAAEQ
jgi:phosphate transport system permease protein